MWAAENETPLQAFEMSDQLMGIGEPANLYRTQWRRREDSNLRYGVTRITV
jgi:hypothetical protein